ncbi:MAG: hypothetical protein DWQ02_25485 [Bacteroidetes bacterium]|nr:MAG: hypothetical protein DWQ02_25485 [Bacteroidota bacterium]
MKIASLLAGSLICLFGIACKNNCPPDEKIGAIELGQTTVSFIPEFYKNGATIFFKNESGETLELTLQEQIQQTDKLCVETICTELEFDGKSTCKYYDAASHRFIYTNFDSSLLMDLLFSSEVAKANTEYFYDIMTLSMSSADNHFAYGQHHTEQRYTVDSVIPPSGTNMMTFQESTDLVDTTFSAVYINEVDQIKTYYTADVGLAGFDWDGTIWRFVRWE